MIEQKAIAVVGMGAILPDAPDVTTFWQNILAKRYSIREVPAVRWNANLYFDPDPSIPDKTYSKIGGWVDNFKLDPFKMGIAIPPKVLAGMDQAQQWGIAAAYQALQHYGYPQRPLDTSRTAVILGNSLAGEEHYRSTMRIRLPEYLQALISLQDFQSLSADVQAKLINGMSANMHSQLPAITEDTMPGELANIIAGRIANVFNFGGPNFVTDAACASSLAAIESSMEGLLAYRFDAALTGGVDRSMGPESYVKFSKIGALSPDGSRPYAEGANGFVMGEGAALFLLKRLEDAEKDGDTIYAVIRGVGGSSDGKGKGITAPNPVGQQRAIERAWKNAGIPLESVGLIEGHGTSTKVGDLTEVNTLNAVFGGLNLPAAKIGLGSVKSNLGHLKSAAGAAGMLKVILALHHKIMPPTANFERPNPNIDFTHMPFYPVTESRAWEVKSGEVRRAGVSAFGFGGTNFHVVVEEYLVGKLENEKTVVPGVEIKSAAVQVQPEIARTEINLVSQTISSASSEEIKKHVLSVVSEKTGYPEDMLDLELDLEADLGIDTIKQAELFAAIRTHYGIPRREDLRLSEYNTLNKVVSFVEEGLKLTGGAPAAVKTAITIENPQKGSATHRSAALRSDALPGLSPLRGLLFLSADNAAQLAQRLTEVVERAKQGQLPPNICPQPNELAKPERLAIDYENATDLLKLAEKAQKAFEAGSSTNWLMLTSLGIYRGSGTAGKVAFLFPGQGSQYVNMLRDLRDVDPVVADTFREADQVMTPILGKPLSSYIFVDGDENAIAQAEKELRNTTITQPAVLTANVAMMRTLAKYGIKPDMVIGHSLGEYAALVVAGVMTFAEALEVVSARGREMAKVSMEDNGCMAAVSAPLGDVERILNSLTGYAVIANINSPTQCVIGGNTIAVETAISAFTAAGFQATKIPVSHAFHTKIVAPASGPMRQVIARMNIQSPRMTVAANVTGQVYPNTREEIVDILAAQVASPVQFIKGIETLYALGGRVFVEVGPKRVLTTLSADILKEHNDITNTSTNHPRKGGLASLNAALCALYAAGVPAVESFVSSYQTFAAVGSSDIQPAIAAKRDVQDGRMPLTGSVVVSGAGLGLPGRNKRVFNDDNIQRLLNGESLIEQYPLDTRDTMLGKRITRLVKSESGAEMQLINDREMTLKLAGQHGIFDPAGEFGIPVDRVEATDISTQLAIASGIEALRDAGIPLVMAYKRTSKGTLLPDRWRLPEALADETGVIFASAFPGLDRMAEESRRFYEYKNLLDQIDELKHLKALIPAGQGDVQNTIDQRIAALEARLVEANYSFDRRFVFRVLAMGHSQFAEHIGARGPNTHVNAACATTTHACSVAEDWIRTGRCRRVVVIAGDDVTGGNLVDWIAPGMLASGAATTEGDPRRAILPFDKRRNGMIMGMGAAALVFESQDAVQERGMRAICEVLSTQIANSAYHGTRLDLTHVGEVMERLVRQAERRFDLDRSAIAHQTVFISHETYTPARGGSASAEIRALRHVFGDQANEVIIANTKGFTGHAMGVGVEDVIAVKSLEYGIVPPIANIHDGFEPDPDLGDLKLSQGGQYAPQYALRLGAGFGSQIAMTLFRKTAGTGERINKETYDRWLAQIAGYKSAELEVVQRTLRIRHAGPPAVAPMKSSWDFGQVPTAWADQPVHDVPSRTAPVATAAPVVQAAVEKPVVVVQPVVTQVSADEEAIKNFVLATVSEKTGYPVEMLDLDLDLEADLGVDTIKQAELFATIRTHYNIPRREDLRLSDYNTLLKIVGFMRTALAETSQPTPTEVEKPVVVAESKTQVTADEEAIKDFVLATVSEKTGYPVEMLDLDLDLEADLGIDTIKQAELFATIRTHYNIPRREDLRLSEYNTLLKVVGFMQTALAETNQAQAAGMSVPAGSEVQSAARVPVDEEALDLAIERKQVEKGGIQRQVPSVVLRPRLDLCQPTGVNLDENSRVLVVSDQGEVAKTLARKLRGRKIKVAVLHPDAGLAGSIQELLTEGNFQGVYFLPALDAILALSSLDFETWQNAFDVRLNALFTLMKTLPGKPFLVCATRMGGMHGYGVEPARAPEGGAVSGFAKAFAWERPESLVKVVDFSTPSNGASPAFIADCLFKETLADSGVVEVGWKNNLRFGIALVNKPVVDSADNIPDSILTSGNVFLVSGGGAGIIAPIIAELAAATSGTFYLLGRTHLPKPGDPDLDLLKTDRDVLKQKLAQRLVTEGLKVTPVLVERKLVALERASAVLETLSQVEKFGAKAHYICCDVTNASMVNQAMDKIIQSQGRVDVFLHAAGVEHSHKLEDKSFDEFRKVFTVKADGFFHIFKALEARNSLPKATVFFSSVAGRFGNAGQTDYSAVNDLLCKYASAMRRQYPAMKTMAIDWGAWAEVGMASRGYIPSLMERAGIEMMNPVQAASMLRKELTALMDDPEVILAGSLGMLLSPRRADGGLDVERANTALRQGKPIHKMVSRVTRLDLQEGVILEAEIDPKVEPYLRDHSMNGTPVLPGVIGIEGFSVAARHVASVLASDREEFTVSRLEDICFDVPFKFYRNEPRRIIWKARVVSEAEGLVAFATLESIRVRPGQKPEIIQHFSGKAFLEKAASTSKDVVAQPPHWNGNATVQSEDIYRLYFHGPSFQVLDGVQRSGDKVLGKLRKDLPPTTSDGRSLSMPLLVELCFQTAGIWEAGTTGILALPHAIESIQLYRHDVNGIAIYAEVTPLESNGEGQRFNARVIDENGSIYLDLQNYSTVALPYSSSPELITPLKVLWD